VVQTVADINEPFAIVMGSEDAERAYVSAVSAAYDSIEVIDTSSNAVIATHPLAFSVSDLVVTSDGKHVYASRNCARGGDIAVLNTTTDMVEVIDLASLSDLSSRQVSPLNACASAPTGSAVCRNQRAGRWPACGVRRRRTVEDGVRSRSRRKNSKKSARSTGIGEQAGLRVIDAVEIGLPIRDVALSPDGTVAYVASSCPELGVVVDVIDTRNNKIVNTSKIGEIRGSSPD